MTASERRALLLRLGPLLRGPDWQRPLARALGPLHPDGARDAIDDRLVRRWVAGDREIPDWVGPALAILARERAAEMRSERTALRSAATALAAF